MFDFRNGQLGVVVVAIAIGAAIFGAYFAGIESVEHEVVKYNQLADVTGLFDTETSPQYVDYDPSSNYTGYYSNESYSDIDNIYYFAEGQVDFTEYVDSFDKPRVNNYRLNLKPTIEDYQEYDLTGSDRSNIMYYVDWFYDTSGDFDRWYNYGLTVKSMVEQMSLDSGWDTVKITLGDDVNWDVAPASPFDRSIELHTILIMPISAFANGEGTNKMINLTSPFNDVSTIQTTKTVQKPYLSFIINTVSWTVECFNTVDYSGNSTTFTANSMVVCYGDPFSTPTPVPFGYTHLDYTFDYQLYDYPEATYLDPNYGVSLKD